MCCSRVSPEMAGLMCRKSGRCLSATDLRGLVGLEYADIATRVMRPFLGGRIDEDAFARIVREAYGAFGHHGGGAAEAARTADSG